MILESNTCRSTSTGVLTFRSTDFLLGIVQRAVSLQTDQRITLPGRGEIVIFPKQGVYYANVLDMQEFCRAPAEEFSVEGFSGTELNSFSRGMSINSLLWKAAFHASQGRIIEGCTICDAIVLRYWPNLTRLPVTPNTARICALLTRYRTVIVTVPHILGISSDEVCQVYSAAYCVGMTDSVSLHRGNISPETDASKSRAANKNWDGLFRSMLHKIIGL